MDNETVEDAMDDFSEEAATMRDPRRHYKSPELVAWLLKRPFRASQVKKRPGPGNKELSYIDARAVMHRLDSVVGSDGWQSRMIQIGGKQVACELSVRYGDEWITKTDGAGETNIEGDKGEFSDAFKRAAVQHGVGRYLYSNSDMTPEQYDAKVPRPK